MWTDLLTAGIIKLVLPGQDKTVQVRLLAYMVKLLETLLLFPG